MTRSPTRSQAMERYQEALIACLKRQGDADCLPPEGLADGLRITDLVTVHERSRIIDHLIRHPPGRRSVLIRRAVRFFLAVSTPSKRPRAGATRDFTGQMVAALFQSSVRQAIANQVQQLTIDQQQALEHSLKQSERRHQQQLASASLLQEQMRRLSRRTLSAQEEERRTISRELHDVIAQTLSGINVRLATLRKDASLSTRGLVRSIARTQQLLVRSVDTIHRFARDLRPPVLDDLGLIPALHTFMKHYTRRTGVRTRLTVFAGVERLDIAKRTVLFRVAQEALTNIARHAKAGWASISITEHGEDVHLLIHDDGSSFKVQEVLAARGGKCLGLLGMRERMEMIGGTLEIASAPGRGTTITARLPASLPRRPPLPATVRRKSSP